MDGGSKKRGYLRVLIVCCALFGAMALVYLSPIKAWLKDLNHLRELLRRFGLFAYPISVAIVGILVGCGIPRLVFCAIGGVLLGFWWGLIVTTLGTLLGYYAVFVFVRWGGRDWVLHRWPKLKKFAEAIHDHGVIGIVLVRQLPIHGTLTNLCLGLSHVRHRQFLIGTAIGLLPEAIPVTLVGAGLVKSSMKDSAVYIVAAVIVFGLIWLGCAYAFKRLRATREGAAALAEVQSLTQDSPQADLPE